MKSLRWISESLQWDYKPHEIDILIPPVGLSTPLDGYLNPSSGIVNPQEGYLNPSSGIINPKDGFLNPSSGIIIPWKDI